MNTEHKDRWKTTPPPPLSQAMKQQAACMATASVGSASTDVASDSVPMPPPTPPVFRSAADQTIQDSPIQESLKPQPEKLRERNPPTSALAEQISNHDQELLHGEFLGDHGISNDAPDDNREGNDRGADQSELVEVPDKKAFSRLMLANSWIISLVVHLAIFIFLSLVTYTVHKGVSLEIELAQLGDDTPTLSLEPFETDDASEGSDLDSQMEQMLASSAEEATIEFAADTPQFNSEVSLENNAGADSATANAESAMMSGLNRRIGNGNDAQFFGIEATGKDFVFIVDSSGSMGGRRWKNAVRELMTSLASLQENQRFFVIFFDRSTHLMFQGKTNKYRKSRRLTMLNASEKNLERFTKWSRRIELGNSTSPRVSFDYGLSLKPDAIFFLTDGEFNDGTYEFLMGVASQSETRPAIHTVAFGNPAAAVTLEEIAARFKGKYQYVAN